MNKLTKRIKARRNAFELRRAIANASTPEMRHELMVIAQRQI
jgi:hypothetical protein